MVVGVLPETNAEAETAVLVDAFDFKGRPAARSTTGRWGAAAKILVAELNERLTTLGIGVNLVTYLTATMHVGNAEAANVVTNFMGTSFMLCLLGGFLADSFLGRYKTIAIFTAVQAMGVTILTVSSASPGLRPPACSGERPCERATSMQMGVLYVALFLTALGTGGLKSSVSGFGSDQFDETDRAEKKQMMRFFHWFFFFISLGSLLAVTVLVYVQDNLGRPWGYGACACAIVLGLVVFVAGSRGYRYRKPAGSPLTQIAAVVVAAWRKRRLKLPSDPSKLYDIDDVDKVAAAEQGSTKTSKLKERLPHTKQFRFLDHAAIDEDQASEPSSKWRLATLTDVEEVKTVLRMLPIWATTIMFWTVYAQMTTFSVSQATTMDRRVGSFVIPAGSLTVFFVGSILLTVPVYDRVVVPVARRVTGDPHGLTPLQRIGVGLAMSVLAMAAAALTEIRRLRVARAADVPAHGGVVVPMSVFWLVPQFFLVGAGEAFTYIGQLDFFLRECPKGMKTMSTGLFLSTLSLGFFVSSAIVAAVQKVVRDDPWIADDLNKGHLDYFYWLLAAVCFFNMLVYLVAARWYKYKADVNDDDDEI